MTTNNDAHCDTCNQDNGHITGCPVQKREHDDSLHSHFQAIAYQMMTAGDALREADKDVKAMCKRVAEETERISKYIDDNLHIDPWFNHGNNLSKAMADRKTAVEKAKALMHLFMVDLAETIAHTPEEYNEWMSFYNSVRKSLGLETA